MGQQKYKIYVNGVPVFLTTPAEAAELGVKPGKFTYFGHYLGKKKQIKQFLDLLDKNKEVQSVWMVAENVDQLWLDFQACFKILEAAGGYVLNAEGKLLVFYRRSSWDMPNGKIDPGETPEEAAVREVMEETGLQNVQLSELIMHTWHTYAQKGERILKKTWWYRMTTTDTQVVPQTEEDIEQIEWVEPKAWLAS
ncbi:MAG: NUDIX domain-containing protein, partial [Saprospiraceae bacterium]|nr:NUDIX domain-containing protein [Saprospiraceae bacterium]